MKVALIGITGRVGSRILAELLNRGHAVTGIARDASKAAARPRLEVKSADATDAAELAPVLAGQGAVISATKFISSDPKALIAAVNQAGVKPGGRAGHGAGEHTGFPRRLQTRSARRPGVSRGIAVGAGPRLDIPLPVGRVRARRKRGPRRASNRPPWGS